VEYISLYLGYMESLCGFGFEVKTTKLAVNVASRTSTAHVLFVLEEGLPAEEEALARATVELAIPTSAGHDDEDDGATEGGGLLQRV
jgi:hypothetical protein